MVIQYRDCRRCKHVRLSSIPTDERRPTVNELSNQKGVVQKATGWKLYHMAAQIEDLVCI